MKHVNFVLVLRVRNYRLIYETCEFYPCFERGISDYFQVCVKLCVQQTGPFFKLHKITSSALWRVIMLGTASYLRFLFSGAASALDDHDKGSMFLHFQNRIPQNNRFPDSAGVGSAVCSDGVSVYIH